MTASGFVRSSSVLLLLLVLFGPVRTAEAGVVSYCRQKIVDVTKHTYLSATRYWQRVFLRAEDQKQLNLPSKVLHGTYSLLHQGLKLSFAPTFFIGDTFGVVAGSLVMGGKGYVPGLGRLGQTVAESLALVPRHALHLGVYFGLSYSGYNAPIMLVDPRYESYLSDMHEAEPMLRTASPQEYIVMLAPPVKRDPKLEPCINTLVAWLRSAQFSPERVVVIREGAAVEGIKKLGTLSSSGRLADIHFFAHSAPGKMNFQAPSFTKNILDRYLPQNWFAARPGWLTAEVLRDLEDTIEQWPDDFVTEDTRLFIHGCEVGQGQKGDEFISACRTIVLQGKGKVVAPTGTYRDAIITDDRNHVKRLIEDQYLRPKSMSAQHLEEYLAWHFGEGAFTAAFHDFFGITYVWNRVRAQEPRVKVLAE